MTYQKRDIKVQITLVDTSTGNETESITISNCRAYASLDASGSITGRTMDLTLWGMSQANIAKIIGPGILQIQPMKNKVKVWADGDIFFEGVIFTASIDMNQAPNIPLMLTCGTFITGQSTAIQNTDINDAITFESAVNLVAKKIGYTVNNYAESFNISPTHLVGNASQQLSMLAESYRYKKIRYDIGIDNIDILQYGEPLEGSTINVSDSAGLIGYPSFTNSGISFSCMYSPKIKSNAVMRLTTALPNGSGDWVVASARHEISAWVDGGPWFSHVTCTLKGGTTS